MSTLTVATVKSNSSSPPAFQNTSGTEIGRLCRAFVTFNSLGTVSIFAQYNVSSITDNGIGDFTLNFTSAFADTSYAVVFGNMTDSSFDGRYMPNVKYNTRATNTVGIVIKYAANATYYDCDYTAVSIFR